ncbi:S-layer homology domain-containing protein [Priestia abyssalis]|uniref:S-layer homology domain-containing protein n=1 Tax=Priestia abyssalis TaxID=1221450 RepID=UPI0009959AA7|nr:S-layer homology domain-containing protein [Priestia abyssalis]
MSTNYRKFLAGSVSAVMATGVMVPVAHAATFPDVEKGTSHAEAIDVLTDKGIIKGYPNGTFGPNDPITRGQTAKMIARTIEGEGKVEAVFTDVAANFQDQELVKAAYEVFTAKAMTGSNGNLMPYIHITREQMAKVLVEAFDLIRIAGKESQVKDLDQAQDQFRSYIEILSENGVTNVEVFRPKEKVTRAQFASFVYRALAAQRGDIMKVASLGDIRVKEDQEADLPKTVEVTYANGEKGEVEVQWSKLDTSKTGEFTVEGTIKGTDKKASVKVIVEALIPMVTKVEAVNLKTVELHFNKKINEDTLTASNITIDGEAVESVELQDDGITVVAATKSLLMNNKTYRFVVDGIETMGGEDFMTFDEVIKMNDDTAPAVSSLNYIKAAGKVTIRFTEPLSTIGTLTLKDEGGVTKTITAPFTAGNDVVEIDTSSLENGRYALTMVGAKDLANNYFTNNKVEANLTIGSDDQTAPEVQKVTLLSKNLVEVTFSEPLYEAGTISVNGDNAFSLMKDSKLDTKGDYKIDATGKVYTIHIGSLNNDAFNKLTFTGQKDYAGNEIKTVTETVSYLDQTAASIVETRTKGNLVYVTFNEKVILSSGATARLVAPNGVVQTVKAEDITVNPYDSERIVVDLSEHISEVVEGAYRLEFAEGGVKDLNNNSEAYKVYFTLTADADTVRPELSDSNGEAAGNVTYDAANGTVKVQYSEKMGASAIDVNNYTVDGMKVFEDAYFNGGMQEVILKLKDGQFKENANRVLKIQNVKDAAGNLLKGNVYQETIQFIDNTKPSLLSAVLASDGSKIVLTFNEALTDATIGGSESTPSADFEVFIDNTSKAYQNEAAVANSGNTKYEIAFNEPLTATEAAKVMTIKPAANMNITDQAGNVLSSFANLQVTK